MLLHVRLILSGPRRALVVALRGPSTPLFFIVTPPPERDNIADNFLTGRNGPVTIYIVSDVPSATCFLATLKL